MTNAVPIFQKTEKEDCDSYRAVSLTSMPGKIVEIILGVTEKHLKDNAVVGHSQFGFTRRKSCLENLIYFHDKATHLVDQGRQLM